jgi:hypothetical protein
VDGLWAITAREASVCACIARFVRGEWDKVA